MRVVRHISTGRIVYRESPDFAWSMGIANAIASDINYPAEELEEVEVTQEDWDAEIAIRKEETLPSSDHPAKLIAVNPALAKPATVRRWHGGDSYEVNCLVSQNIVNMWTANPKQLNINDWVLVSFLDELTETGEKQIAIVKDKIFKSW